MSNEKDTIYRQDAIDLVRDVCDAVMSGCESQYDPETEDEVYKDIREVDAILKCNKEVRIALRNMPSAQPERQVELDGTESNIEILSELRAQFNCFDEVEEPVYRALSDAICALSAQPERKKGRWLPDNNFLYETRFICSNCKESECVPTIGFTEYHPIWDFCPNCGADMRQRGDNNG